VTATTLQHYRPTRTGARYPRPRNHVKKGVAEILATRLGLRTPKAAQSRIDRARELLRELITAAHEAGQTEWLRWWFTEADALRHGPRLPFHNWLLTAVSARDNTEDQRMVAMLADPNDPEARSAWIKSLEDEIVAKQELLAAVKGALHGAH
jgi:hypothetical protein